MSPQNEMLQSTLFLSIGVSEDNVPFIFHKYFFNEQKCKGQRLFSPDVGCVLFVICISVQCHLQTNLKTF